MAAAPNYPTYKWWETDDKTKRLYTELLAEKLSSPRKTSSSSLSRKPSNGKDIGARFTSSPKRNLDSDADSSKVTESSRTAVVKNKEEEEDEEKKFGKYTFETITIDTLAKYDYIKSPQKRAALTVPISFFEQTCKPIITTGDNKEDVEKAGKTTKGQFLTHQKVSSAKKEFQISNSNAGEKESSVKRDKAARAMKLEEIPEYSTSSETNESSADETVVRVKAIPKNEEKGNKTHMSATKSNEEQNTKQANKDYQPLKIEELSNKFQLLSEEVAQLEFKMFEFSDDIQKLKQNMGFKSVDPKDKNEEKSHGVEKKNEYAMTHQKSLTFAEKFNNKAMLMKQQASPSKMLAAKPGKFFPGKLPQKGTTKEEAMAELKKNETLNEIVSKIKEQELSEDEIQEILRCAKDKYVDRPNYLEEMGYGRENNN